MFCFCKGHSLLYLREYLPLKQGLRLIINFYHIIFCILREYLPLKQGLRQLAILSHCFFILREHLPLKQGLRPLCLGNHNVRFLSESIFH